MTYYELVIISGTHQKLLVGAHWLPRPGETIRVNGRDVTVTEVVHAVKDAGPDGWKTIAPTVICA